MLVSERGIPLLWGNAEILPAYPTVTVENYCKWYALYVVHPDGHVERVAQHSDELEGASDGPASCDHVFIPAAVQLFADKNGYLVCPEAMEMIVGRYMIEVMDQRPEDMSGHSASHGQSIRCEKCGCGSLVCSVAAERNSAAAEERRAVLKYLGRKVEDSLGVLNVSLLMAAIERGGHRR